MNGRKGNKMMPLILIILFLALVILSTVYQFSNRKRKIWVSETNISVPQETADELYNPRRGGYHIYQFTVQDEQDFDEMYALTQYRKDTDTNLALVEINLCNYSNSDISEEGMQYLRELFRLLTKDRKDLIVRFLYDFNGTAFASEPKNLEQILSHMRQVSEVINDYKDRIYTLQGLFIGNWGEMNGSRYSSQGDIQRLAETLLEVTDSSVMLAVRTPALYRMLCGEDGKKNGMLSSRLGLFNDGMLGNEHDLGTYSSEKGSAEYESAWIRSEELAFQDDLCRSVYNGGEVLSGSSYSLFPSAAADFSKMHVSYLNLDYDKRVWDQWRSDTVEEDSVFNGMDGETYMLRHLGYRPVVANAVLNLSSRKNTLEVKIRVQNDGFAPIYRSIDAYVDFSNGDTETRYKLEGNLSAICCGESALLTAVIDLEALEPNPYTIALHMYFEDGTELETANAWDRNHTIGAIKP